MKTHRILFSIALALASQVAIGQTTLDHVAKFDNSNNHIDSDIYNSSGMVGINTTSPGYTLDVDGTSTGNGIQVVSDETAPSFPYVGNMLDISVDQSNTYTIGLQVSADYTSCGSSAFNFGMNTVVTSDAEITFGTHTSPEYTGSFSGTVAPGSMPLVVGSGTGPTVTSSSAKALAIGALNDVTVDQGGINTGSLNSAMGGTGTRMNIGAMNLANTTANGGTTPFTGLLSAYTTEFSASEVLYNDESGANHFNLYADGAAKSYFEGNVGIGTETPSASLHVDGTFQYEDGNEAAGYVLASDANGVASWQSVHSLITPSGQADQTLRFDGTDWVGVSNLTNDGTDVTVANDLYVNGEIKTSGSYVAIEDLNVTDELKIGTNSIHIDATGGLAGVNHLWTSNDIQGDDNLYVQSNDDGGANSPTLGHTIINGNESPGRVGIGTGTPDGKLEVTGEFYDLSNQTGDIAALKLNMGLDLFQSIGDPNGVNSAQIILSGNGLGDKSHAITTLHSASDDKDNVIRFWLWDRHNDQFSDVGSLQAMAVSAKFEGSLGIGTFDPDQKLHITGENNSFILLENTNSAQYSGTGIKFVNTQTGYSNSEYSIRSVKQEAGASGQSAWQFQKSNDNGYLIFMHMRESDNAIVFNGNKTSTENYGDILVENGRVVVGDRRIMTGSHTDYLMSVDGKVVANSFVATLTNWDWPDYVFAEGYQLQDLCEVDKFINENKHLPGIPSQAKVVSEGGVDLAEMNVLLLQKIEELTLYTIQQQKEIEELKNKVK